MGKLIDDILKLNIDINGNKAKKELAGLEQSTKNLQDTNKSLRIELEKLKAAGKKNTDEYKALQTQIKSNNATIKSNGERMKALREEIGLTGLTMKQLRQEQRRLQNAMDNATPNTPAWRKYRNELRAVRQRQTQLRSGSNKAGKAMNLLKGALPILSVGALAGVLKSAATELFGLTRQMQGDAVRSSTVFGNQLNYVQENAAKLAEQMGLTNREFVANAAATADLLIPLDFTREQSAKMSVELQKLTGALDEWTAGSIGAKGVSEILTKAMLGENEQLKQLGIAISMNSDEFKNLVKEKKKAAGVTEAQAKAMATLELITKKSADAQAAYNQEGNKLLRLQKSMRVWWQNIKESVVEYFTASKAEKFTDQKNKVNTLTVALYEHNLKAEDRKKIVNELKALAPDIVASLDAEGKATDRTREALEKYNNEMIKKIFLATQQEKVDEINKDIAKATNRLYTNETKLRARLNDLANKNVEGKGEEIKKIQESGKSILEQAKAVRELGVVIEYVRRAAGTNVDKTSFVNDIIIGNVSIEKKQKELAELLNTMKDSEKWFNKRTGTGSETTTEETTNKKKPLSDKEKDKAFKMAIEALEKGHKERLNVLKKNLLEQKSTEDEYRGATLLEELNYLEQKKTLTALKGDEVVGIESNIIDKRLELLNTFKSFVDELEAEDLALIDEEEAKKADDLTKKINELAEATKQHAEDLKASNELRLLNADSLEEYYQELRDQEIIKYEDELFLLGDNQIQKELLTAQHNQRLKEIDQQYLDERTKQQEQYYGQINSMLGAVGNMYGAVSSMYEASKERELAAAKGNEVKQEKIRKKYAEKEQRMAKSMALINGATAIMNVWAKNTMPYPAAAIYNAIQTAAIGLTTAAQITKINASGYSDGGFTPKGGKYEPAGIVHKGEFVGAQGAVNNPTIKPFFDIIDVAQKNGTISTLDLSKLLKPQLYTGGYSTKPQSQTPAQSQTLSLPSGMAELLERNTKAMERLEQYGVKGVWEYQNYKQGREKYENLEKDVGFTN